MRVARWAEAVRGRPVPVRYLSLICCGAALHRKADYCGLPHVAVLYCVDVGIYTDGIRSIAGFDIVHCGARDVAFIFSITPRLLADSFG